MNFEPLISEWKQTPHGEKSAFFTRIERDYGINKDKFYREKRKIEGKSKTVKRKRDKKKRVVAALISEMKERGKQRSDKPREMPTELCLERLAKRGVIDSGEMSASHINYILREELGYRDEQPRVRWEADYALQEVQTDGSVSKYFRPVKQLGDDTLLKASGRPLNYKGRDIGKKLILWQYQDKYSRLRTVRGFPGMAESTAIMAAHMNFWLNREEDDHMMRHLAWELAHDNGSIFKSEDYKSLARALEFTYRTSAPYEKTGIGSVENRWQPIWTLEMVWSEDYPTMKLSEYNMLLHEAMMKEQKESHPTQDGYKGDLYQQSILRQKPRPRSIDFDVFELLHKTYERTVTTELKISVEKQELKVPQHVAGIDMIGEKVTIYKNWRGKWAASLMTPEGEIPFELTDFTYRSKGDFSGSPKTTFQQELKEAIKNNDSIYEGIMNGDISLDSDGNPFDAETGEVLENVPVKTLQPRKEIHVPDSPFNPSDEPKADQFDNVYEAKVWIGKKLKVHGMTYGDVASHFDERLDTTYNLEREQISKAVEMFLDILTQKTKTA